MLFLFSTTVSPSFHFIEQTGKDEEEEEDDEDRVGTASNASTSGIIDTGGIMIGGFVLLVTVTA